MQIQQVVLNLVMNGIEAMREVDDRPRQLVVGSSNRDGEVVVTVSDSGVGIDPGKLDRLFEPFFTTKAEGMGMGLSVSRSIVESHGGRLWASSGEASGATFRFTVPMAVPA